MGFGKTLTMIALIATDTAHLGDVIAAGSSEDVVMELADYTLSQTLVIVPPACKYLTQEPCCQTSSIADQTHLVLDTWEEQLSEYVSIPCLSIET